MASFAAQNEHWICELKWVAKMEWIESQEFQKTLSATCVNVSGMHFGYVPKNIQNRKCRSLYNHRTYSLVYRYQAYKAGHGISPQNFWKNPLKKIDRTNS